MSDRTHWYGPPSKAARKAWTAYIRRRDRAVKRAS